METKGNLINKGLYPLIFNDEPRDSLAETERKIRVNEINFFDIATPRRTSIPIYLYDYNNELYNTINNT